MDVVIHLAGIAHVSSDVPEKSYDQVNRKTTQGLAQAAVVYGVKHFIFVSSIRAQTGPTADKPLNESDLAQPTDAYGARSLRQKMPSENRECRTRFLRPVVIYGPGAKANMASMIKFADSPFPLPFGASAICVRFSQWTISFHAIRFLLEQGPAQRNLCRCRTGASHIRGKFF
jgi:UDP-glucose 4-epimerase